MAEMTKPILRDLRSGLSFALFFICRSYFR
jgi:hypothetical protein